MFEKRLKNLQKSLSSNKIDALLVSSPINIQYLTGYSNFSIHEREAYLLVTERSATLFTDPRYIEAVERVLPNGIKATIKPILKTVNRLSVNYKISKIGFEKNLTFAEYQKLKNEVKAKFVLTDNIIEKLRTIKDEDELTAMRKAAKLTDECYSHILKNIGTNVTEKEIAWEIEMFIKKFGGTLAFDSIVAFGPNASIPHHMVSGKKLSKKDEFIKLDFGTKLNGYCCDMTRTVLLEHSSDRARKIYQTVLDAQSAAIEYLNNTKNPSGKEAYEIADKVITDQGFPSIPHGLGHGVGLEVHEKPTLSKKSEDKLSSGMVFSVEPGIYIPGFGGVRIEDTVLYNNGKVEELTKSTKTLLAISI